MPELRAEDRLATLREAVDALHNSEHLAELLTIQLTKDGYARDLVTDANSLLRRIRAAVP